MTRIHPAVASLATDAHVVERAPGRANLIGEHTDYNEGFVLPIALELATYVIGDRIEGRLQLTSRAEPETVEVDLATGAGPEQGWGAYVTAVVRALRDAGAELAGLAGTVWSDVPIGAGLSSSAALEVAVARAVCATPLEGVEIAEVCRGAENHYVGLQSGIMDQLTSAAARRSQACLIDCRDNSIEYIPIPEDLQVLVIDSGTRRSLATSLFNERRRECQEAAEALGVPSLRDASLDDLDALSERPLLLKRARHVIAENERTLDAASALRARDLDTLGRLFTASHESYAHDFEASRPEIDTLVDIARRTEGIVAARLTGGGWGGCTVNVVEAERAQDCGRAVVAAYESATGRSGRFWISEPSEGATSLR